MLPVSMLQPATRDALGLVRLLYEAERSGDANPARLVALVEAGKALNTVADFLSLKPETMGFRAAPAHIQKALERLDALRWPATTCALLTAARRRLVPAP